MATLHLIRHGQASFGAANYDQLSETGYRQGRVLGRWQAATQTPDAVYCGTLQRHRQTLASMAEGAGADWDRIHGIEAGLNEFDHLAVINAWNPAWSDRSVMAKELAASGAPGKTFQKAFVAAVERWVSGNHASDYAETWDDFQVRVWQAVENIMAASAGAKHVYAVTSGGPISVIVQRLLQLDDRKALGLNAVLANASVSRMLFSGSQQSLAVFNSFGHFEAEDPALVTYR
ncbi:MAG: histidine phosphatase family protein [Halomonadaceae bacterium]|nr:MAG: histidine phosphatase family protein [Halomonadaceae bacterium]